MQEQKDNEPELEKGTCPVRHLLLWEAERVNDMVWLSDDSHWGWDGWEGKVRHRASFRRQPSPTALGVASEGSSGWAGIDFLEDDVGKTIRDLLYKGRQVESNLKSDRFKKNPTKWTSQGAFCWRHGNSEFGVEGEWDSFKSPSQKWCLKWHYCVRVSMWGVVVQGAGKGAMAHVCVCVVRKPCRSIFSPHLCSHWDCVALTHGLIVTFQWLSFCNCCYCPVHSEPSEVDIE